jgi:hypothetical protein
MERKRSQQDMRGYSPKLEGETQHVYAPETNERCKRRRRRRDADASGGSDRPNRSSSIDEKTKIVVVGKQKAPIKPKNAHREDDKPP